MAGSAITAAMLKQWRSSQGKSQGECALVLGMRGGARSFQRIETGESSADADTIDRIVRMTGGAVTVKDMHDIRLAWLRQHRPEKFAADFARPMEAAE
jgi:hypothetical protein